MSNNEQSEDEENELREYHVVVEKRPRLAADGTPVLNKHGEPVVDVIRNMIGLRVKLRRLDCRWTHRDLSSEIQLISNGKWIPKSQETLRIEQQRKFVTDYETQLIAKALRCSVAWLIGESNEEPEPYRDGLPKSENEI
jgi:hypothetical protein